MENDPLSLPSSGQQTIVSIASPESTSTKINIPSGPVKTSSSSPSSSQPPSGTGSGVVQHTFYKPRATSIASARRSRAESLTNSLNNTGVTGATASNYPPSSVSLSRPPSFSRSRPHSASYASATTTVTPSTSLTHTGGILPPASFFHPKQPPLSAGSQQDFRPPPLNANNVYAPPRTSTYGSGGSAFVHHGPGGRPSSGISSGSSGAGGQLTNMGVPLVSSTSSHAREHGLIMLPLTHIHSRHSDGSTSGPEFSSYSDSSQRRRSSGHTGQSTRVKPSREALLPIGEKETLTGSFNSSKTTTHTGVRGSLEKIFRRATTSSERERNEAASISKDNGRTVMDEHARAASSLSAQLRGQPSLNDGIVKPEQEPTTDPKETPMVAISEAHSNRHDVTQPVQHAFEGVSLEGTGFTYGPERNWQVFPSQNTFFFNGRLLTGGDSPLAFLFSISVVLGIGGTWFGTTAVWWWRYESPAVAAVGVYMCLLTVASMFHTAMRDPGILPRNLDIDPPYPNTPPVDGGPRVPLPRDMRVRAGA
jgi:palmitoyltransferase ZDHHC9/14/18